MAVVTTIHFHRLDDWATAHGIVAREPDAFFGLCRILADRGWHGPAVGIDERGMRCWTVGNIATCARRYRPNADDLAAKRERDTAKKTKKGKKT
jgi:hypothetical protein